MYFLTKGSQDFDSFRSLTCPIPLTAEIYRGLLVL